MLYYVYVIVIYDGMCVNRKAAGLNEIPPEVWKTRQFDDTLLRHCNAVYNQNPKGARGVIVIVVGNEHSDTSSNPARDWLHFP